MLSHNEEIIIDPDPSGECILNILQQVNNTRVLKELLEVIPKSAKELMVKCNSENEKKKVMYSNFSFYELIELRYKELIKTASN